MRIISYNVNGIRAAIKKGFIDWLKTDPADIICVQETKATKEDVDHEAFHELGYFNYWFSAQKKGYSGVAVFTKIKPDHVEYGNGHKPSDDEDKINYDGEVTIVKVIASLIHQLNDKDKLAKLSVNIAKLGFKDSAMVIANEILSLINKRNEAKA